MFPSSPPVWLLLLLFGIVALLGLLPPIVHCLECHTTARMPYNPEETMTCPWDTHYDCFEYFCDGKTMAYGCVDGRGACRNRHANTYKKVCQVLDGTFTCNGSPDGGGGGMATKLIMAMVATMAPLLLFTTGGSG